MCSGAFGRLECSSDHMMQLMQVMLRESNPPRCRDVTFLTVQVADMDSANIELEDANTQLEASTNAAEQRCAALEQEVQKLHSAPVNPQGNRMHASCFCRRSPSYAPSCHTLAETTRWCISCFESMELQ